MTREKLDEYKPLLLRVATDFQRIISNLSSVTTEDLELEYRDLAPVAEEEKLVYEMPQTLLDLKLALNAGMRKIQLMAVTALRTDQEKILLLHFQQQLFSQMDNYFWSMAALMNPQFPNDAMTTNGVRRSVAEGERAMFYVRLPDSQGPTIIRGGGIILPGPGS